MDISQIEPLLSEHGVHVRYESDPSLPYANVSLERGRSFATFDTRVLPTIRPKDVPHLTLEPGEARKLLVLRQTTRLLAERLRVVELPYIDLQGNMNLSFGDVYIHVEGRRLSTQDRSHRPPLTHSPVNFTSTKRAQVVMALVSWPELAHSPVRELAHVANVSDGMAHITRRALLEHHVMRVGPHGAEFDPRLIDAWVTAYPTGLGRNLTLAEFEGEPALPFGNVDTGDIYVSGEALAPGLRSTEILTIYVRKLSPELVVDRRWRPSERPNVVVRRAFWKSPRNPLRLGPQPAPPLIAYADMVATGDSRVREAAERFRSEHIGFVSND